MSDLSSRGVFDLYCGPGRGGHPPRPKIEAALNALPTVVLDPGHGGKDDGASGNGLVEKNLSLDVALRVEKILKPFNFPVVMTRRDDTFIPLEERAAIANRWKTGSS